MILVQSLALFLALLSTGCVLAALRRARRPFTKEMCIRDRFPAALFSPQNRRPCALRTQKRLFLPPSVCLPGTGPAQANGNACFSTA